MTEDSRSRRARSNAVEDARLVRGRRGEPGRGKRLIDTSPRNGSRWETRDRRRRPSPSSSIDEKLLPAEMDELGEAARCSSQAAKVAAAIAREVMN